MIDLLLFLGANLALWAAGVVVLLCLAPGPRRETLWLAWGVGLVALAACQCALSLCGIAAGARALWLVLGLAPLAWRRGRRSVPGSATASLAGARRGRLDPVVIGLSIGLLALLVLLGADALARPFSGGDAQGLWAVKARIIAHEGAIDYSRIDYADSHSLGYPPLIPVAEAFLGSFLGGVEHDLVRLLFPAFVLWAVGLLWFGLARTCSPRLRLGAALILLACPHVLHWASAGMADVPLLAFALGSLAWLTRWLEAGDRSALAISILLAAGASLTRLEGTVLLGLVVAATALFAPGGWPARRRALALGAALFLATNAAWFALRWSRGYSVIAAAAYPLEVTAPWAHPALAARRLGIILSGFASEALAIERWSFLWILLGAIVLLHPRGLRRRAGAALVAIFALYAAGHAAAMYCNPMATDRIAHLVQTYLSRGFLHLLPAAAVAALYLLARAGPGRVPQPSERVSHRDHCGAPDSTP